METLPIKVQNAIDIHMAYFHPEETIFSVETQRVNMLGALSQLSKTLGTGHKDVIALRGAWFGKNKQAMYDILDKYIDIDALTQDAIDQREGA